MPSVVETYIGQERRRNTPPPPSDEGLEALRAHREELLDQLAGIRNAERSEGRLHGHQMLGELKQTTDAIRSELQQRAEALASEVREYEQVGQSQTETERYRQAVTEQADIARELQELLPPVRSREDAPGAATERLRTQLAAYAESFDHPCAEGELARKLASQIGNGGTHIDLSQRYLTSDPVTASARHERALQNLNPFVRQAERLGCSVDGGEAITAKLADVQKMAVFHGAAL